MLIEIIITSTVMILIVLILRAVFWKKINSISMCLLWGLVALRLLFPFQIFGNVINISEYLIKSIGLSEVRTYNYEVNNYGLVNTDLNNENLSALSKSESQIESHPSKDGVEVEGSEINQYTSKKTLNNQNDGKVGLKYILWTIWAIGTIVISSVVIINNGIFYRKLTRTRQLIGTKGKLKIYYSKIISVSCLYGIFRPAIYVTESCLENNSKYIINHEVMHHRHKDNIWALIRMVCVCIYWFNPFVWVAAHFHKIDTELYCDSCVIKKFDSEERIKYGEVLLKEATHNATTQNRLFVISGASSGYKELKRRIVSISLNEKVYRSITVFVLAFMGGITIFAFGKGNVYVKSDEIFANQEKILNNFSFYLVSQYEYDITNDGIKDKIILELYGVENDNTADIESVLYDTRKYIKVTAIDGVTEKELYSTNVGQSQSINGAVSIVRQNNSYYIMEIQHNIQQGEETDYFIVYEFINSTKNVVAEYRTRFYISDDAMERAESKGIHVDDRKFGIEQFKSEISKWLGDDVLLVACDLNSGYNNEKGAYVSSKNRQYVTYEFSQNILK